MTVCSSLPGPLKEQSVGHTEILSYSPALADCHFIQYLSVQIRENQYLVQWGLRLLSNKMLADGELNELRRAL